jgi:hypothetical protein
VNLHFLAETLGMTVGRLRKEMSVKEYFSWLQYFKQRNEPARQAPMEIDSMEDAMRIFGPGGS